MPNITLEDIKVEKNKLLQECQWEIIISHNHLSLPKLEPAQFKKVQADLMGKEVFLQICDLSDYKDCYTQKDVQRAEIEYKLKCPLLHQANLLNFNMEMPKKMPICIKETIGEDSFKDKEEIQTFFDSITELLTRNKKENFFDSSNAVTNTLFGTYRDPRIDALTALFSNPYFQDPSLEVIKKLNLIRNEIISAENKKSSISKFYEQNFIKQNHQLNKLVHAIKEIDCFVLEKLKTDLSKSDQIELSKLQRN